MTARINDSLLSRAIYSILKNAFINDSLQVISQNTDAFYRSRVSEPFTVFDSKQLADKKPLLYDDQAISGTGTTSTHSIARASTTLGVSANTAGHRVRQTFRRFNYQAGKSQLVLLTGVFGPPVAGVTKRRGYFDGSNGLFFQQTGDAFGVVVRSSVTGTVVDTLVTQEDWNLDTLDGNGPSGITLDPTKTQIFFLDFEWLGVGRVRWGLFFGGKPYYVHETLNANVSTAVYMSTPNLPIRTEIIADGSNTSAASIEEICSSVMSEGGVEETGTTAYIDRGITGYVTGNNQNLHPILSLRLKPAYFGTTIQPTELSMVCTSTSDFRWLLMINPVVAGTDQADWVPITNSALEYDISRDDTNTLSGGIVISGGLIRGTSQSQNVPSSLKTRLNIGSSINGTPQELVLAYQRLGGSGNETVFGGLSWAEID